MNIQRYNYEPLGLPQGPYVHAVTHKKTLYTSGLTAFGTQVENGTISEQARVIFMQLKLIAEQHNTSLQNLIKVTLFVTDLADLDKLRNFLFEFYGENLPASTLIKVDSLFAPELFIEVEATLAI